MTSFLDIDVFVTNRAGGKDRAIGGQQGGRARVIATDLKAVTLQG